MNISRNRLSIIITGLLVLSAVLWSGDASAYTMNQTKDGTSVIWCKSSVVVYVDTTHVKKVPGVVEGFRSFMDAPHMEKA